MNAKSVSTTGLVKAYIQLNHKDDTVLVIYTGACDSLNEISELKNDLFEAGIQVKPHDLTGEFLFIEMSAETATKLINKHRKSSFAMELYVCGECFHENS